MRRSKGVRERVCDGKHCLIRIALRDRVFIDLQETTNCVNGY